MTVATDEPRTASTRPERRPKIATPLPTGLPDLRDKICLRVRGAGRRAMQDPLSDRPAGRFERKTWQRTDHGGGEGGGGTMSIMHGRVFEKVGVNISTVHGTFSPEFRSRAYPVRQRTVDFGPAESAWWRICKARVVPAVHMNTRMIVTTTGVVWGWRGPDPDG